MSSPQTNPTDPSTTKADLEAAVAAVREHDRFLVTAHENPDGDALGSLLGACLALRQLGKDAVMFLAGEAPLPAEYGFLAFAELLRTLPDDAGERVLLAVDCANESRLGPDPEVLQRTPFTVNIDHHHDNNRFGDVNLIDAGASSTSEVLADVFARLGVTITPEIAEPLYTALVTDTGRFQYANTTPKALRLAADLVEAGADVHKVFQGVYESVQFAKLKLLARALERAQVYEGGRLVVSFLRRDDFAEVGAAEPYSEGIIDYLRAVEGRRDGGADPGAATRRLAGQADLAPVVGGRAGRLGDRPRGRRRRSPAGRRLRERRLDRGRDRLPRQGAPCRRRARLSRPGSSSSTSRPARRRSRSSAPSGAGSGAHGARRHARPVRDRAAAAVLRAGRRRSLRASSASASAT